MFSGSVCLQCVIVVFPDHSDFIFYLTVNSRADQSDLFELCDWFISQRQFCLPKVAHLFLEFFELRLLVKRAGLLTHFKLENRLRSFKLTMSIQFRSL